MSACHPLLPRSVGRTVAVLLLVALAATLAVVLPAGSAAAAGCVEAIAHRGAAGPGADENTVEAIAAAAAYGAAEVDVHVNADHHLIVMHDARVDRTTDGTGYVKDLTLEQIRQLRTTPSGNQVPTLWQALRAAAEVDLQVVIELKEAAQWTPELYARVDRFWQRFTARGATIFVGGKGRAFEAAIPAFAPHVQIYWRPLQDEQATVANATALGADMVMDVLRRWTPERVAMLRAAGFVTAARYTTRLRLAARLGLDYALTDDYATNRNTC